MVQPTQGRRSEQRGRSRTEVVVVQPTYVRNAQELRGAYIQVKQSPDGIDPDPLTLPKCVECSHCGWPVYPRESKVATKKTFARAGIIRTPGDSKKSNAQDGDDEAQEVEQGGSVDSRNTVERMADDLEDLKDKNDELESTVRDLEAQNEDLKQRLASTEESLRQAEDKIELMEEAELRWRDKLFQAQTEIQRLLTAYERSSLVSSDREGGLVKTIKELQATDEKFATFRRRRGLLLDALEVTLRKREEEDRLSVALRMWRVAAVGDKLRAHLHRVELRRRAECRQLQDELDSERALTIQQQATIALLRGRLTAAAQRMLLRSLSSSHWPSAHAHAFRAWCGAHPALAAENALEITRANLEDTRTQLSGVSERAESLQVERDALKEERDTLSEENSAQLEELELLRKEVGTSKEKIAAKLAAEKAKEEAALKAVQEVEERLAAAEESFAKEREDLEMQIRVLDSRVALAEAIGTAVSNAGLGAAGSNAPVMAEPKDEVRIVPRGQGVLCVGCLKQLVHRGVRPLPPATALSASAASLDQAKRCFFEKELQGAADPDDALHTYAFAARKDPYGVSRLTLWPTATAATTPKNSSPPATPARNESVAPTTGLPALKKDRLRGLAGVAPSLRMSSQDFRPRHFR